MEVLAVIQNCDTGTQTGRPTRQTNKQTEPMTITSVSTLYPCLHNYDLAHTLHTNLHNKPGCNNGLPRDKCLGHSSRDLDMLLASGNLKPS